MARLKLFLTCLLVLWFTGRSPVYAQTGDDDSDEGSGNVSINGDMSILDCCKIFIGDGTCYQQCVDIHNTPPSNWLDPILRNCSSETFTNYEGCIISFSTAPTSSTSATTSFYSCCEEAHTENCTRECQRLIVADGDINDNFLELVAYCGDVIDIVTCILRIDPGPSTNTTPTPLPPADLIRRRCCHTAVSDDCRTDCLNFYADVTNEEAVETNCVHRPTEGKLASCLADVSSACKLGCSDMEFCRTFNNRPNQLFRKCVPDSDDKAKLQLHEWESTRIFDPHLTPELRLKNISQCLPEMWKLLACFYHTEPCHPVALTTYMCRHDCMKLLTECSQDLLPVQVEKVCERLSPSSNDSCIPLSLFMDEHEPEPIHQPCSSNPCKKGEVCQVNSGCALEDPSCLQYRCVHGCFLGNNIHSTTSVPVPNNTIVQIQLPQDDNCTGYVQCNSVNLYQSYTGQSVRTEDHCIHRKVCYLPGGNGEEVIYQHGESFWLNCSQCYCNYGRVSCSPKNCTNPSCPHCVDAEYDPVCTTSHQTLPSRCVALCQGWREDQLQSGNCGEFATCNYHNCPVGTKCVENRQVCLGKSESCRQYSCESYSGCQTDENTDIQPACDSRSQQWATLCNLLQARRQLAFRGFCKPECSSSGPVCGMDGNVYASSCHANSYHVAVDYVGACNGSTTGNHCANVMCPELPSEGCTGVLPAGACCPVCGGVVEVLFDAHNLDTTAESLDRGHVSVQDVLKELNARLSTVECVLHGHVTVDGTFVVISLPTKSPGSAMMVEVCNAEAALVASCINNKSPLYLSSPLLSHLLQAELLTSSVTKVEESTSATPQSHSSGVPSFYLTNQHAVILPAVVLLLSHLFNGR